MFNRGQENRGRWGESAVFKSRPHLNPNDRSDEPLGEGTLAALRVSEIRYRRLFEAARDGVLLVDPETRKITDVNPFMVELLGYGYAEFVGRELWEIGLLKDRAATRQMFVELRKSHFVRYDDLPLKSSQGQTCEVEVVANLYEEDGHPVIQCNIRDITERKLLERGLAAAKIELQSHAASLEQTVAERTAALQETIGELAAFSYSISHDMRAPLRAIRGFAEILLADHASQLDNEGIASLKKIDVAAARLDRLIQDVLAYTRVLRAEVKVDPVNLDGLVRQVITMYPQLNADRAEIQIEGVLPWVLGGEASLTQCVSNLLTNAVKFVAPGAKPHVKVWAETLGPNVRLWVEDNGIGISSSDQARVFKMFEQVNPAGTYEGNGMGLAIVNKAVERMGAQRGVESETGRGSKFWIQLKRVNP